MRWQLPLMDREPPLPAPCFMHVHCLTQLQCANTSHLSPSIYRPLGSMISPRLVPAQLQLLNPQLSLNRPQQCNNKVDFTRERYLHVTCRTLDTYQSDSVHAASHPMEPRPRSHPTLSSACAGKGPGPVFALPKTVPGGMVVVVVV